MTDRRLIALAAAAIILWALWAGVGRAAEFGMLKFYQPDSETVIGYEFQLLEGDWVDLDSSDWILEPCDDCEQVTVEVPQGGLVRIRAYNDAGSSMWADCPIVVPEPGVGVGLMVGVGYLCYWSRRVKGGPGTIPAPRTR